MVKTKPETTCKRMPRQFCRNENCEDTHKTSTANILDGELCYYRIQMVRTVSFFICYNLSTIEQAKKRNTLLHDLIFARKCMELGTTFYLKPY